MTPASVAATAEPRNACAAIAAYASGPKKSAAGHATAPTANTPRSLVLVSSIKSSSPATTAPVAPHTYAVRRRGTILPSAAWASPCVNCATNTGRYAARTRREPGVSSTSRTTSFVASHPCAARSADAAFRRSATRTRRDASSHANDRFIPKRSSGGATAEAPRRTARSAAASASANERRVVREPPAGGEEEEVSAEVSEDCVSASDSARVVEPVGRRPTWGPWTAATRSRLCLKLAHTCTAGSLAGYLVVPRSRHVSICVQSIFPSPPPSKPIFPRYRTDTSASKIQCGRNAA